MTTENKNPIKQDNVKQSGQNQRKAPTIPQELETVLGAINWLTLHSPAHRHLFISDLEWSIIPPVMLKQFKLFKDNEEKTIGYTSWARINKDVENRILSSGNAKLAPGDWNSGDIIYLIDALTPFGGNRDIIIKLYETEFKNQKEVFIIKPKKDGKGLEKILLKDLILAQSKQEGSQNYN